MRPGTRAYPGAFESASRREHSYGPADMSRTRLGTNAAATPTTAVTAAMARSATGRCSDDHADPKLGCYSLRVTADGCIPTQRSSLCLAGITSPILHGCVLFAKLGWI